MIKKNRLNPVDQYSNTDRQPFIRPNALVQAKLDAKNQKGKSESGQDLAFPPKETVPPEEQEKLKAEFGIYAEHYIKQLNANTELSDAEKVDELASFQKKKEKFLKKMGGDELKHWGGEKYAKFKAKYFPDYDAVITDKKKEVKGDVLTEIQALQGSMEKVTGMLLSAVSRNNKEAGKAQIYLDAAQKELDSAKASKSSAEEKLTGYTEGVKTGHLAVFDQVIEQLQLIVNNTANRIGAIGEETATNEGFIDDLKQLDDRLNAFKAKLDTEDDVQALIELANGSEFAALVAEVNALVEKSRPDALQQPEGTDAYDVSNLEGSNAPLEAEHTAIDERVSAQPNTRNLQTLTEKQIHELAATAYAEGANQGYSLRKIVWVYMNNVRRYKYNTAMNWSAAYKEKQWLFKKYMYVTGQGDEYENDICYSEKTFGELFVKGEPDTLMTQLLDFTREYVGENAADVPARFSSLDSQGYYNDMNLNYSTGDKAKWHKARLYLLHKLENKVSGEDYSRYIQVVGTHENLTFLYDQYHIQEYLNEQYPDGIPAPKDVKKLYKQGEQWYLDGHKVSATAD